MKTAVSPATVSWRIAVLFVLVFPWLNPAASGPSPAVMPWLVALACAILFTSLLLLRPAGHAGKEGRVVFDVELRTLVLWAWLLAGLASCCIGLLQYFGATAAFEPWLNQARFGEAYANLRQRNQFASLTSIALVTLIWFAVRCGEHARASWTPLGLMLVAASLLAVGNAASSSRTGMMQLVLLCGMWGVWRGSRAWRVLAVAVLVYVVAALALPLLAGLDPTLHGMAARLRDGDEACASRLTLWSNVLHLIIQKPWLGWGWGELDYAHYITLYDGPRFCGILDNAHNLPLQLAVELGVPAALLLCGGFSWWVLRQRPWRETDPTRQLAWSVMAVILLHSMLEYPLWYGPFQIAFGLCIGLLWSTRATVPAAAKPPGYASNDRLASMVQALAAIVLITIVAYAAWDYRRVSQVYLPPEERDAAYRDGTLAKIQGSWLFADQVHFAQLLLTPLARDNAQWTFNTATALLHYSPEPRVIEKTIESAVMLGRDNEALVHLARYSAAFPEDHERWTQANAKALQGPQPMKQ